MTNIWALSLTLLSGLFFVIGFLIVRFIKQKKELSIFSTSLALVIMLGMLVLDILPEIDELQDNNLLIGACFILLGIIILKIFDIFLPHHHHEHHENEKNTDEHNHHLFHVGFIMATSLILHNILEGMSMYIIGLESLKSGLILSLGVGLHNLPLGMEIACDIKEIKDKKGLKVFIMLALILSTFLGGLIILLIQNMVSNFVLYILMCLAAGMIIYITIFELLKEVWGYKKNKFTYYGIILGIIIILLMIFIG